jgi:alpha-glucosidase
MSSMQCPPRFKLLGQSSGRLTLGSDEGQLAHIFVLEEHILRVMVLPDAQVKFPRTWAIAPGQEDVPRNGRDRFDLSGFSLPEYNLSQSEDTLTIATQQIRLTIRLSGLFCSWETYTHGIWQAAAEDRTTQAYNFGWWDEKVYHYLNSHPDEMYFGLGERTGETNRLGSSYRLRNQDSIGYNARTTDPLYKHIPFYLTWRRDTHVAFGLFYDTLSDCTFDMGRERDGYHPFYHHFVADHGDLDYYFIAGEHLREVTRTFTWLTGQPAFMPRWSLGYSGSTMTYTDAPNAQERMNEFLDKCDEHDILCDSFHLSSGYTSIGNKRYVFNWSHDKFPDPTAFIKHYLDHGVRLCANIKPCLLRDHPRFEEAASLGLFVKDASGKPLAVQFWDETGA